MKSYAGSAGLANTVFVPFGEELPNPNGYVPGSLFYRTHGGTEEGFYVHDGRVWSQIILQRGGTITGEMSIAKLTVTHLLQGNLSGNANSATKLMIPRELSTYGDANVTLEFDGSDDAKAELTLVSTGVTPGTYNNVTVDAKGRVLRAANIEPLPNLNTITSSYTTTATDEVILCNNVAKINLSLLPAAGVPSGRIYTIKAINSGPVEIVGVIDGRTGTMLTQKYEVVRIVSDGKNWYTI